MAQRLILALFAGALLAASRALAQAALADPTRPPEAARGGADPGLPDAAAAAPKLQSVLIAGNRRLAVIDGRAVSLGDRVGEAKVTAIRETEVTLRRGAEVQTLQLYPGIERRPVKTQAPPPKQKGNRP